MRRTLITVDAAEPRARVGLTAGTIVPRLIDRGPRSARIALVAAGALLLGGDRIEIVVRVGAGCVLELHDIGGTVAYGADGVASFWHADIEVEQDGCLLWAGLPLVVADGSDVRRSTRISLAPGGVAVVRESVVLGRSGERGGRADIRTSVRDANGPLLEEAVGIDGIRPVPGVLGRSRVLDGIVCAGFRPPVSTVAGTTVMPWDEAGASARFLGAAAHESPLDTVWSVWAAAALHATSERSRDDAFV